MQPHSQLARNVYYSCLRRNHPTNTSLPLHASVLLPPLIFLNSAKIQPCFLNTAQPELDVQDNERPEPVFVNVYGAQESIPRNRFRQSM